MNTGVIDYIKHREAAKADNKAKAATSNARCPDPTGCEDALRAEAAELGIQLHHAKRSTSIKRKINDHKKEIVDVGECEQTVDPVGENG